MGATRFHQNLNPWVACTADNPFIMTWFVRTPKASKGPYFLVVWPRVLKFGCHIRSQGALPPSCIWSQHKYQDVWWRVSRQMQRKTRMSFESLCEQRNELFFISFLPEQLQKVQSSVNNIFSGFPYQMFWNLISF